jgi:hypothetical protein
MVDCKFNVGDIVFGRIPRSSKNFYGGIFHHFFIVIRVGETSISVRSYADEVLALFKNPKTEWELPMYPSRDGKYTRRNNNWYDDLVPAQEEIDRRMAALETQRTELLKFSDTVYEKQNAKA